MPRVKPKSNPSRRRPGFGEYLDKNRRIRTTKNPRSGLASRSRKTFAINLKLLSNKQLSLREASFISNSSLRVGENLCLSEIYSERIRIARRLEQKGFLSSSRGWKFIYFTPTAELKRLIDAVKKLY